MVIPALMNKAIISMFFNNEKRDIPIIAENKDIKIIFAKVLKNSNEINFRL